MRIASRTGHRQIMSVILISDKIGSQCGTAENSLHKRLSLSLVADTPTGRTWIEESFLRFRTTPERPVTLVIGRYPRIIATVWIFGIQNIDVRMFHGITSKDAVGRRRSRDTVPLYSMPGRIMVERAVIFCPVTPYLVVHILRSTLAVDPQSHDRSVCRSSDELVCVLARPIVAIVRNGRERILSAPLIIVAHCIGRFIFTF